MFWVLASALARAAVLCLGMELAFALIFGSLLAVYWL